MRNILLDIFKSSKTQLAVFCIEAPSSFAGLPSAILSELRKSSPDCQCISDVDSNLAACSIALGSASANQNGMIVSVRPANGDAQGWTDLAKAVDGYTGKKLGSLVLMLPLSWSELAREKYRTSVRSFSAFDILSEAELTGCIANLLLSVAGDDAETALCFTMSGVLARNIRRALAGEADGRGVDAVHFFMQRWYASTWQECMSRNLDGAAEILKMAVDMADAGMVEPLREWVHAGFGPGRLRHPVAAHDGGRAGQPRRRRSR